MTSSLIIRVGNLFVEHQYVNLNSLQLTANDSEVEHFSTREEAVKVIDWCHAHGLPATLLRLTIQTEEETVTGGAK